METIKIIGSHSNSTILLGETIKNISKYIPNNAIIITDKIVNKLYNKDLKSYKIIEIDCGEKIKTIETVSKIYEKFIEYNVDRTSYICGVGGGIVCDITGFAASTYMRGLRFGFVSTTLLSQVDASVGGKNGVNFFGYKNIIGTFNQPEFVICDFSMLKTLEKKEILNGYAEIIKCSLIADSNMLEYLKSNVSQAINLDFEIIQKLVTDSIIIKSRIVNADEKEKNERRKLNFGHTIGHAIEKHYNISHGEAISIGMVVAAQLSLRRNLISTDEFTMIKNLIQSFGLPTEFLFDKTKIIEAIAMDKKRESEDIHFVFINKIGNAVIEKIKLTDLKKEIDDLC
ncbi:MAG TPA: 3-dehydroquinate synthase [Bacteroidales bacterium]|nr:MAG: 3-dehydroquinate synthase [Bacteroidetes bacterium GWF2_33_38]OFY91406.1 MAG: 3-dehydroquinate synthase [Bacteroidetes bacterium RIFOXYA2_FULL_33_7]HBF87986.1 3-dehydroquinate synthase [Bacteroidales bacterium]